MTDKSFEQISFEDDNDSFADVAYNFDQSEVYTLLPINKEDEHNDVAQETKDIAHAFIISSCIGYISDIMIMISYIIFAISLNNTSEILSIMVFLQSFGQIIGILLITYFSNKFGYDNLLI